MKKIKIYGERNTGTNFLSNLLRENLDIELLEGTVPNGKFWALSEFNKNLYFSLTSNKNLGWKHALVAPAQLQRNKNTRNVYFLTVSKNPYSFLLSLYKNPYHYKGVKPNSLLKFLQTKWYVQGRENVESRFYRNPVELWNSKNHSYLQLKEKLPLQTVNLKYEDLLENPEAEIDKICQFLKVPKKQDFKNYTLSTKDPEKSFSFYQNYYLNEQWVNLLKDEEIEVINQNIDQDLMDLLGYKKLCTTKNEGA